MYRRVSFRKHWWRGWRKQIALTTRSLYSALKNTVDIYELHIVKQQTDWASISSAYQLSLHAAEGFRAQGWYDTSLWCSSSPELWLKRSLKIISFSHRSQQTHRISVYCLFHPGFEDLHGPIRTARKRLLGRLYEGENASRSRGRILSITDTGLMTTGR